MSDKVRKIRFRFLFECKSALISRYNKFYSEAETFNDVIELTYQKFLQIADEENIDLSKGKLILDSFQYNNKYDYQIKVKESHNKPLENKHKIFHITLKWNQDKNKYMPQPKELL